MVSEGIDDSSDASAIGLVAMGQTMVAPVATARSNASPGSSTTITMRTVPPPLGNSALMGSLRLLTSFGFVRVRPCDVFHPRLQGHPVHAGIDVGDWTVTTCKWRTRRYFSVPVRAPAIAEIKMRPIRDRNLE